MTEEQQGTVRPGSAGGLAWRAKRWARWTAIRALDRVLPRLRRWEGEVLLVAGNQLMADYVVRLWDCIAGAGGIRAAAITDHPGARANDDIARRGIRVVSPAAARARRWDLLLLADHAPLDFLPSTPRAIVAHGVARSRHVSEGSYYYDPNRVLWPDGRPVYDVMFDASEEAAAWARQRLPALADRIVVAGDLRVDELVELAAAAPARRRALGWEGRTVVGVFSTWSAGGLVPTMGEGVVAEVERLVASGRCAAVLTMHPNLWDPAWAGTDRWRRLLEGVAGRPHIHVVDPAEDWAPWLALVDVAVTDHTSLAATFAVLRRPMIPTAVPDGIVGEGTFAAWLLANRRPMTSPGELPDLLDRLDEYASFDGAPPVVDGVGQARQRTRAALLACLGRDA